MLLRNFCIIAHIDHGKSTLADRMLEITHTVESRKMRAQYLDAMDLERERGITIKMQPVRMIWRLNHTDWTIDARQLTIDSQMSNVNGQLLSNSEYVLNLIDTPGHIDFNYEVSRSLAAVEGAVLLVDATQGIQAQTVTNLFLAQKEKLAIIPVINKIDLPSARVEATRKEIVGLLQCKEDAILTVSAKTGEGVEDLLRTIIVRVPPPCVEEGDVLRALIFDAVFDEHRGVVVHVRLFGGSAKAGDEIVFLGNGITTKILEVGYFKPNLVKSDRLIDGEIGYIVTGFKELEKARIGDTVARAKERDVKPLAGYREPQQMVFAGFYPKGANEIQKLRAAIYKLKLNDSSLYVEPENSSAFGFGFRVGFLGILHMDIIRERLKREHDLEVIITAPSVAYETVVARKKGAKEKIIVRSAGEWPEISVLEDIFEPYFKIEIITPENSLGRVLELIASYRGSFQKYDYLTGDTVVGMRRIFIQGEMPAATLLFDFYDKLKSVSSGFASLGYEFLEYREADIIKLTVLVAGAKVEALSALVYKDESMYQARRIAEKLKEVLPRQLFEVKIQVALGGKILASEHLPPIRKDVTAKLYGGDVTRKKKVLERQRRGKKELLKMAKMDIPPEAYTAVLGR